MNCEKFLAVANELPLMEANERESVLAHATECDSCAALWEEERRLTLGLRNLAEEMNSHSAPPQLEEKMLAAFRERGKVVPIVRPFPVQRRQSRYWLAAVAAALLIVFGIVIVRGRLSNGPKPQLASTWIEQPGDSRNMQAIVGETSSEPARQQIETPAPGKAPRRNPRSSLASFRPAGKHLNESANPEAVAANSLENNEANKEVATDFFPIGYGTAPNLQDGGQLLRVELPRSAVVRFGLPVNMDRTSERVKADVLVGADGLAQAIRFIH